MWGAMLLQDRAYGGFRFPPWNPEYLSIQDAPRWLLQPWQPCFWIHAAYQQEIDIFPYDELYKSIYCKLGGCVCRQLLYILPNGDISVTHAWRLVIVLVFSAIIIQIVFMKAVSAFLDWNLYGIKYFV